MAGCEAAIHRPDGLITVDVNDSYSTKKELGPSRLHGGSIFRWKQTMSLSIGHACRRLVMRNT